MSYRTGRAVLAVATVGLVAACKSGTEPRQQLNYGIIAQSQKSAGGGAYRTSPTGSFFTSLQLALPTSVIPSDSCAQFSFPAPGTSDSLHAVSPGDSVAIATDLASSALYSTIVGRNTVFVLNDTAGIAYSPGANITFTLPGATGGFPSTSITAHTAEPLALDPVATNVPVGTGIDVHWTPAAADTESKVVLSLQYASQSSNSLDRQVLCSLRDDGSATVPADLVRGWVNANNGNRHIDVSRWRTTFKDLTAQGAALLVISTFDTTGVALSDAAAR